MAAPSRRPAQGLDRYRDRAGLGEGTPDAPNGASGREPGRPNAGGLILNRPCDGLFPMEEIEMIQTQTPAEPPPTEKPTEMAPTPLSPEEAHRLGLKTEQEARRQAEVGQIVRGDGG
ncbi:hypothetical protein [Brevundimonas sp.]|uniref:hypothetical protein n=1 Tax=Brevundimonas sp. TaxID=1871086 RepID=UPI0037BF304C